MTLGDFINQIKPLVDNGQLSEHSEMFEEIDGKFYEVLTVTADDDNDLILTTE